MRQMITHIALFLRNPSLFNAMPSSCQYMLTRLDSTRRVRGGTCDLIPYQSIIRLALAVLGLYP